MSKFNVTAKPHRAVVEPINDLMAVIRFEDGRTGVIDREELERDYDIVECGHGNPLGACEECEMEP